MDIDELKSYLANSHRLVLDGLQRADMLLLRFAQREEFDSIPGQNRTRFELAAVLNYIEGIYKEFPELKTVG